MGHFRVAFKDGGKCEAFCMKMIFNHSHAHKTHFHNKGIALGLILKWGFLELGNGLFPSVKNFIYIPALLFPVISVEAWVFPGTM